MATNPVQERVLRGVPDADRAATEADFTAEGWTVISVVREGDGSWTITARRPAPGGTASLAATSDNDDGVREINEAGVDLVKKFEGIPDGDPDTVNIDPYLDPVGIWTIGWGHAISVDGKFLRGKENRKKAMALYPDGITFAQATQLLRADLLDTCRDVSALVDAPLTDNQFAALVSFTFNLGRGNLAKSTLLKKLNDEDYEGAAAEFVKWNKADGKVLKGLTLRREAEQALFEQA